MLLINEAFRSRLGPCPHQSESRLTVVNGTLRVLRHLEALKTGAGRVGTRRSTYP
jgi:hypothetical protein